MSLVIGVDPGGTTGLAAVTYTERDGYGLPFSDAFPLLPVEAVAAIESYVSALGTDAWWIAAERFVVSRRAGRSSTAAAGERARAILGALEAAFPRRVKLATASAAKTWASDTRICNAGLWPAQGRPHTTDAVRHALRFHVANLGNPDPLALERRRG